MVTEIQVHDPFSGGHVAGWSIIQRDMQFIEFSVFQIIGKRDEKFLISAEMRKVINAVYADFRLHPNDIGFDSYFKNLRNGVFAELEQMQ